MQRIHLFEWEDLPWFPHVIRQGMTDYLRWVLSLTKLYEPATPIIAKTLKETATSK